MWIEEGALQHPSQQEDSSHGPWYHHSCPGVHRVAQPGRRGAGYRAHRGAAPCGRGRSALSRANPPGVHPVATRKGFHSVLSATRELRLFLVVSVFTQHATTGQAPIEVLLPEARRMPLYRLINDPFRSLQERNYVKPEAPRQICSGPRRLQPRSHAEGLCNAQDG